MNGVSLDDVLPHNNERLAYRINTLFSDQSVIAKIESDLLIQSFRGEDLTLSRTDAEIDDQVIVKSINKGSSINVQVNLRMRLSLVDV